MNDEIPAHDVDKLFLEVPQMKIQGLTWSAIPILDHDM